MTRRVAPLAGATDAPRAVARIALPRSNADEPRRAAPATAKVDVTADMSCERVGRVRWRFAFGGGTTEVVARCVVTCVVSRRSACHQVSSYSSMTAKQKQMVHCAVDSSAESRFASFSEIRD